MYYDLHLHSALSPCGDNDMTPNNVANMAVLNGLELIALTDHNTCRNCPAFAEAAERAGIRALFGMELNTMEDIHAVCLFESLADAMRFDAYVYEHLPDLANDPAIFGEQRILDGSDQLLGTEPKLLINATDISIMDVHSLVEQYGGVSFPAHIDKDSYSITTSLGFVPPECGFVAFEVKDPAAIARVRPLLPSQDALLLHNSDAHYLWDIGEPTHLLPDGLLPASWQLSPPHA